MPTITENDDIVKYYKNGTNYRVKILGKDGKSIGYGYNVEFNINGVIYHRQTNNLGAASLNINLIPGDYIITASFDGCKVSNNIKVLPTLKAEDINMENKDGTRFKAYLVDGKEGQMPMRKYLSILMVYFTQELLTKMELQV